MRIISGTKKGLRLKSPKGLETRPTADRVKESIFNILFDVSDSVVIDVFSGSGSIGIEFLSRGSEFVYFIESNKVAAKCIEENVAKGKFGNFELIVSDYLDGLKKLSDRDIRPNYIYIDPPYDRPDLYDNTLKYLYDNFDLSDCIIIVEMKKDTVVKNLNLFKTCDKRKYNDTLIQFLRRL